MSTVVDSRVVEMRFDNKEFERNARTTINTLNDLKYALDNNLNSDAFDALDRAASNVDLSGIEEGIEALTDRFSTMGIVGMQVIQNITNAITNNLANAINTITDSIVQGGIRRAENIEKARFQLEGLLSSAEEVEEVMANASTAVDGTAFSLDAAANAASQFAASGIQAGEDMTKALTAISGVAATTSSSYEDIARVFTTVAGNGRLMGDQLLQLSVRGLNAAASLRDYFNGVRDGSIEASEATKELVSNLFGATSAVEQSTQAINDASSDQYTVAKKAADDEYNLKKKSYDAQYKELQKFLNDEYNAKKDTYDKEYRALQEALSAEVEATNEQYQKRLDAANKAYQEDVDSYRKATEAKIALIDQEYIESIKLIDEERYNKIKAIDDQIKAINDQAEAEAKARELAEEEEQRALLQRAVEQAKFSTTRKKAEEALAAFEEKIRLKRLAEQRNETIKSLQEEKTKINDEAALKKQEAADKRQKEREAAQKEQEEKLKQMAEAHQAEIDAIRKEQKETLAEMQKSNADRLEALRSQQSAELASMKEAQQAQLESQREFQNEQLALTKEADSKRLEEMKSSIKALEKEASGVAGFGEITEATIREMVSKGLISFDIFSEAMATTFGEHAYDANKTFQGAMSNIRSALARTGAMFVTPLIAQMNPSGTDTNPIILLLNTIREKINDVNAALKPFAELITNYILELTPNLTSFVSNLNTNFEVTIRDIDGTTKSFNVLELAGKALISVFEGFLALVKAVGSWIKPIIDAFTIVFKLDFGAITEGADGFKSFAESITASEYASSKIKETFLALFLMLKKVIGVVFDVVNALSPLGSLFVTLTEIAGTFTGFIAKLITGFISFIDYTGLLDFAMNAVTIGLANFVNTVKQINSAVRRAFDSAFGGLEAGKYFTEGFLNGLKSLVPDVLAAIVEFGRNLIENLKKVLGIHSPSTEAFDIAVNFVKGFINGLLTMTKTLITMAITMFTNFIQAIKDFFGNIDFAEIFSKMSDAAVNIINSMGEGIQNGIPKLLDFISEMFTAIKDAISGNKTGEEEGGNFIVAFVKGMGAMIKAIASNVYDIFTTLFEEVRVRLEDFSIKEMFKNGVTAVKSFAEGIASAVPEWAVNIGESFNKLFGNLSVESITAIGAGLATIWGFIKLAKALKAVTNPFKAFTNVLSSVSKALGEFAFSMKMDVVLKIAAAVGILAASFIGMYLAIGDQIDLPKLITVGAILLGMVSIIGVFVYEFIKIENQVKTATQAFGDIAKGVKRLATAKAISELMTTAINAVIKIVTAIGALVVLYNSYKKETEQAVVLLAIIGMVVTVLMGVFALISAKVQNVGKNFKDSASSFTGLAAALYIVVLAITKITDLNIKWSQAGKRLLLVAAIIGITMVVMAAMVKMNNKLSKDKKSFEKNLITSFATMVIVTLYALDKLIKMGAGVIKNISQLLMIGAIFAGLMVVMKYMVKLNNSLSGEGLANISDSVFGLIGFLIGVIFAIGILKDMKITEYIKGLSMVAGAFIVLGIACTAANKVTQSDGYKSILAIGAVIGALIIALSVLSMVPLEGLAKSTVALCVALLALSKTFAGAGTIKGESYKSMIVMLITIVAIAFILAALSDFPWENLLATAGSIGIVLVAMGESLKKIGDAKAFNLKNDAGKYIAGLMSVLFIGMIITALSNYTDWKGAVSLGASISAVLLAMSKAIKDTQSANGFDLANDAGKYIAGLMSVLIIGLIIAFLSRITDWKGAISLAGSISAALLAMGKAIKDMSGTNITKGTGITFIGGLLAVAVVGAVIAYMSNSTDWQGAISLAGSISSVLLALGVSLRIMGSLQTTATQAVGSGIVMAEGVLGILAIMEELAKYSHVVNKDTLLPLAISTSIILIALGATMYVLSYVGTLAKQAAIGIGALDAFIADLAIVMYALGELTSDQRVKDIIQNGGEVLASLGSALGNFVGSIVGGIGEGIADSFPHIGQKLSEFMEKASGFFDGLNAIKDSDLSAVQTIASIVLALGAADVLDAISNYISLWPGSSDAGSFGEKLAAFGKGVAEFADATKDVDGKKLEKVSDGALALAKMASEIPNEGGLISKIVGENDIAEFGNKLVIFSQSIKEVAENFSEIKNVSKLSDVAKAMGDMVEMAATVPNSGGWLETILGSNDIDEFGQKLVSFSSSLKDVATNFEGVTDLDSFGQIADAMSKMIKMANDLPNSGGLLAKITGDNDIAEYGEKLETFSESLVITGQNMSDVSTIVHGLNNLRKIIPRVSEIAETMKDKFSGYKNVKLDTFLDDLNNFVTYLKDIVDFSKSIDNTTIETVQKSTGIIIAIKGQFEDDFGEYSGTFIQSVLSDLLSYVKKLVEINNKADGLDTSSIENIYNKKDLIYGFMKWFEKFESYKAGKIKEFGKDLKTFAKLMQVILALEFGDGDQMSLLVRSAKESKELKSVFKEFKEYKSGKLKTFLNDVKKFAELISTISSDDYVIDLSKLEGFMTSSGYLSSVREYFEGFKDYSSSKGLKLFFNDFAKYVKNISDLSKSSEGLGYLKDVTDATQYFIDLIPQLTEFNADNFINFLKDMKKYGEKGVKEFLDQFNKAGDNIKSTIKDFLKSIHGELTKDSYMKNITNAGKNLASKFVLGIKDETSIKKVVYAIETLIKEAYYYVVNDDRFYKAGEESVDKFVKGITDNLDKAADAGSELAKSASDAAADSLDEKSPSKAMFRIGSFAGEGFVNGFSEWVKEASAIGADTGEAAKDGLREAISKINSEFQNEYVSQPVISPIIDLSNVDDGISSINSMFDLNRTLSLAGNTNSIYMSQLGTLMGQMKESIESTSNDDVIEAINGLREDMYKLVSAVTDMDIIMDTGELVGALIKPLDNQLGYNAILAERRVR